MGSITREKCKKYSVDSEKVRKNEMAFEEFRKGLLDGIYYSDLGNDYCGQLLFDEADLAKVKKVEEIDTSKARMPLVRAVSSSGGFSSITKAFVKPSIPFEVEFNGEAHKISVLTIMHPSPIRVENVQHDAMLTLGDPGEGNNDGLVILVPLVGSLMAGASGAFIAKIARYMTGILTPNPATGQYESIDIPTGSDWKLSSIFPGAPGAGGKTFVKYPGYYIWSGQPPMELKLDRSDVNRSPVFVKGGLWEAANTDYYSWKEIGKPGVRYIMLSEPVQVSSMDLQTILMLPSTPITEAISPMVKSTLSYRRAGSVGTDGKWVTECPARLPSASSFFGGSTESFTDQCDPFAPGSFPSTAPDASSLVKVIAGVVGALGVFLAIYFAVKLWTQLKPGRWLADKGEQFGNAVAQFSIADARKWVAPAGMFKTSEAEEAKKKEAEAKEAEARKAAVPPGGLTTEAKDVLRKDRARSIEKKGAELKERRAAEPAPEAPAGEPEAEPELSRAATYKAKADAIKKAAEEAKVAEEIRKAGEEVEAAAKAKEEADAEAIRKAGEEAEAAAKAKEDDRARLEAESESLAPRGRPGRRTQARLTPTAGPSALDRALAKKKEAEAAKLQQDVEDKTRKDKEEADAAAAVEADIKKEKEKLEAEEEARIKAASEAAAASASDVAAKTLKRRTIKSSDRALVPPPAAAPAPSPPASGDPVERIRKRIFDLEASVRRQSTYLKSNPPGPNEPNRIRFETLEKRLLTGLRELHAALEEAEGLAGSLPALEKMGLTKLVKDKRSFEKKELEAQKVRFDILKVPIPTANVIKGGRRKRLKRKSTRRYVA